MRKRSCRRTTATSRSRWTRRSRKRSSQNDLRAGSWFPLEDRESLLTVGVSRRQRCGPCNRLREVKRMATETHTDARAFIKSIHGVRYQVADVARSVGFYTQRLGFTLEHQQLPAFASVSLGGSDILLSGPGASGSRPMPNGQSQEPGGWNRVVLQVSDLAACINALEKASVRFRNQMEVGPGGRQIQIEDPDGNPIELFEPAR